MKIENIEPRDIHIILSLSINEIEKLLISMERCKIEYNKEEEPEIDEAVKFFSNDFFNMLSDVCEGLKKGLYNGS